jgi:hypothetical protein
MFPKKGSLKKAPEQIRFAPDQKNVLTIKDPASAPLPEDDGLEVFFDSSFTVNGIFLLTPFREPSGRYSL